MTKWGRPSGAVVDGPETDIYRDDAAFWREGGPVDHTATVALGGRSVAIYCTGMMRVSKVGTDERYQNRDALVSAGYRTDRELFAAEERGEIEFENNPWFEVEVEYEYLDLIAGSYTEAILMAEDVLIDPAYAYVWGE